MILIYNGIQEGISFDLFLFTDKITGGTFGIKTTEKNFFKELEEKINSFNLK